MRELRLLALTAAFVLPVPLTAQAQKVVPPKTVYWLSAATQTGFGMAGGAGPSAGDMMRMAMGGGGSGPVKLLELDLGSKLPPVGPPQASHAIPPAMDMGEELPLRTPKRQPVPPGSDDFERPKGKLLLFWGCGETARPGQPVVIDFAKVAAGQIPPGLFAGERVRINRPPSAATWPTHGHWPNDDRSARQSVPGSASLVGDHLVSGNYTPDIKFALQQDWMQGVSLKQAKAPSGALQLSWNLVPGATGHFAQLMGGSDSRSDGPTVVFWSSSESQSFVSALSDYVSPAEAARLVGLKQLMPPAQTSCAVPKEALAAAEGAIVTFVSHGPEVNIVHPPRPKDPKATWVQEWAVKARFASRSGAIAGMEMDEEMGSRRSSRSGNKKEACKPASGGMADAVAGALGGSLFGKKKKADCQE